MLTTLNDSDTQLALTQQRAAAAAAAAAHAALHSPPPAGLISPRQRRGAGGFADQSAFDHPFEPQLSSSLLRVKFAPKYRDPFEHGTHSAEARALDNSPTRRRWLQHNGTASADGAASSPQLQQDQQQQPEQLLLTSGDPHHDSSMRSDLNESEPARDTPVPTPRHTLGAAASAASSPAYPAAPMDVDALSEQIMFDMQALRSLQSERDALHKKAASTMAQLREQEEVLRAQRMKAGGAAAAAAVQTNEPSTAAQMQALFDTQMAAHDERMAELEYSVHEAAKRMALEQQRQQQQQQQQQLEQQQQAQPAPASASRTARDSSAASSFPSPAQAVSSASNHSLSNAGYVLTPAPPLDFAEPAALTFSDPAALLESKSFESVLPLHLHKTLAAYKAGVVARVTARDQQLSQQFSQRLRDTQRDAARQYRALADTYAESLQAASLQTEELAHYQQGVAFFEEQLRAAQAQLAESEERRREITAHFNRVQTEHAAELQAAQSAAAARAAEDGDEALPTAATHPYSFVAGGSASTAAPGADPERAELIAAFHADIAARDARIVELDDEIQSIRAFVDCFAAQDPAAQTALQLRETQKQLQMAQQQIAQLSEALSERQQQQAESKQATDADSVPKTSSADPLPDQSAAAALALESERSAWAEERSALESRLHSEAAASAQLREELSRAQQASADSSAKLEAADARATELAALPAKLAAAETAASNVPLLVDQLNQLAAQLQEKTRALDANQTASAQARTELAALRVAHEPCAAALNKSQRKLRAVREVRSEFERQIAQMERHIDATSREVARMSSARGSDAQRIRDLETKLSHSLELQETMAKAQQDSLQQTMQAMRARTHKQPQQQPQQQPQPASFTPAPSLPPAVAAAPSSFSLAAPSTPQLHAPFTPAPSSRPASASVAAASAIAASPAPPFVRDDLAQQLSELQALRQSLAADPVTAGPATGARSTFHPPPTDTCEETKQDALGGSSMQQPPYQQQQQQPEFASPQQPQRDTRSYPQTQQRPQQQYAQPMHESFVSAAPAPSALEGQVIVSSHTIPAMTVQTIISPVRNAPTSTYAPAAPFTPQQPPAFTLHPQPTGPAASSALRSPPPSQWTAAPPVHTAPLSSSSSLFRAADAFLAKHEQDK